MSERYRTRRVSKITAGATSPEFSLAEAKRMLASYYKEPRKVLELLVKKAKVIRLKRGLYVLKENYDPLAAANVIASPSYVSFETSLSFYSLIPERVYTIVSVIDGRSCNYTANSVDYVYRSQRQDLFALGMSLFNIGNRNVLMASREKALLDTIASRDFATKHLSPKDMFLFANESLRIEEDLFKMNVNKLKLMAELYWNKAPKLFAQGLKNQRRMR